MDNLTPELLHLLGQNMIKLITLLYKLLITSHYTPSTWRYSKVIMIPKPGKSDYSLAKAYRPISLTPFLFKNLERLCYYNAYETALLDHPMHKQQHAYRSGYSTESAISKVIDQMEKGLLKQSFTLGTFIDIASAFDKLDPKKAIEALINRGIDNDIIGWYGNYLTNRYSFIEMKGLLSIRHITIGCPQGGGIIDTTMVGSI